MPRRALTRSRLRLALPIAALILGLSAGTASASSDDARVRFTGAMEGFAQPNLMPALDTLVEIRKESWDFVWTGKVAQLIGGSLGPPKVLVGQGGQLTTFTDRPTCSVPLAYQPGTIGPFIAVESSDAAVETMSIPTPWSASYIDSVPTRACTTQFQPAYTVGKVASNATWSPQHPSISYGSVESEGVQHLSSAIFRVNTPTPETDVPFSFSYSYTNADGSINKIIWVGRVQIVTDPQGKLTPIDMSDQLPGSAGQGLPGDPSSNNRVDGDFLLHLIDEATGPVIRDLTSRSGTAARAATASPTLPLPPPESWAESGTLAVRVCAAPRRPSKRAVCSGGKQNVASGQVHVSGVTAHLPGAAEAAVPPPNAGLPFKPTTRGRKVLRAKSTKYLVVSLAFTGDATHTTVSASRAIALR